MLDNFDPSDITVPFSEDASAAMRASYDDDDAGDRDVLDASASIRTIQLRSLPASGSTDFTLLGVGSVDSATNDIIKQLKMLRVTSELFDVLSGQADVDHPLCEECTDRLLTTLDTQYRMAEDECRDYKNFLETLQNRDTAGGQVTTTEDLDKELQELQAEEQRLLQELRDVDSSNAELEKSLEAARNAEQMLKERHTEQLREYNTCKRQIIELEDAQRSVDNQIRYAEAQLEKLKKTNAFNAAFHIWHNGPFGTINGFRLGRLPSVQVEWSEINAAWGQAVLLLNALARKTGLQFRRYRLIPYGSQSYIEDLDDAAKELPLHAAGGMRFLWDYNKFDHAMVAYLDCLQQFQDHVERGDTVHLPYKMSKGKIEDSNTGTSYSIKIQFNSEEQWTKALKFMLTNLKWGLTLVLAQFASKD